MRKTILTTIVCVTCTGSLFSQGLSVYLDETQPIEERIEDALSRMTTEEKVSMCHAQSKFSSPGVARLGIPELWTSDGPHGIRPDVLWDEWQQAGQTNDSCIAFPALTCLAATWNRDMASLYGVSIGEEARYRKKDILLGPGVNIYRSPLNGRNFEYMGEDPYLAAQMVVPYIQGVQRNGVAACVKHFALNNQETDRNGVNVQVDDRTLYEIYLPAFRAAVQEGGAWSIMGSYNLYKDIHCCHNPYLLQDILRGEWKFDGVVVSDWGGTHNTDEAVKNGLDLEFGSWTNGMSWGRSNAYDNYYLAYPYLEGIKAGTYSTKELDEKVRNILRLMFRTTMNRQRPLGSMTSEAHSAAARKIAEEGIVLLKNERNVLPIDLNQTKRIAVIGENAIKMMTVGGGSSSLKTKYEHSPIYGIQRRAGNRVVYARGYVGDTTTVFDGVSTGQVLADYRPAAEITAEAVKAAQEADVVVFVGGLNKSAFQDCEGEDRQSYALPYRQNELIEALVKANPNLVVVNMSGNAVEMPWAKQVPSIIQTWYTGSETGDALAAVLFGDVNPSGKLPFSYLAQLSDYPSHSIGEYPGKNHEVNYSEGIFVGYRWVDKKGIAPLFSFGHGLSYTTFEYGTPSIDRKEMTADGTVTVSITVKNTGKRAGAEVVQLYISDLKSSLPRPKKELKGFEKIYLESGEQKTVSFQIDASALSFFDAAKHAWTTEKGDFEALIGASSTNIKGKTKFRLK